MLIVRKRYENDQRDYFKSLYSDYGRIPSNHLDAIKLRQAFFDKWVLHRVYHFNNSL